MDKQETVTTERQAGEGEESGKGSPRKSAMRRKRPVKDLGPRKAPTGGAVLGDGSVRFVSAGISSATWY